MRYELRLTAYDALDQVYVSTALYLSQDRPSKSQRPILVWQSSLPGTGQSDPREWAIDALLTALEDV